MFVAVKGQRKGFDLFPACMLVGNIVFDQLGIGDFVHGFFLAFTHLWMRKCIGAADQCRLQKFLDGLLMERKIVLHGVPNIDKVNVETFGNDLFSDARHILPLQFGMFILKFNRDGTGGFPDQFDLAHNGILHHGARKEFAFRHASCIAVYLFHGCKDVV